MHLHLALFLCLVGGASIFATGQTLVGLGFSFFVVQANGDVYGTGYNAYGNLAVGHSNSVNMFQRVLGVSSPRSICLSSEHACFVDQNGAAKCIGNNASGRLGDSTENSKFAWNPVFSLSSGVSKIVCGMSYTCVVLTNGGARCWGHNNYGQLGNGNTNNMLAPVALIGFESAGVSQISLLWGHTCVLSTADKAWCTGWNAAGQLGIGNYDNKQQLQQVSSSSVFSMISCGPMSTCALTTGGAVYCWGYNNVGQLGSGSATLNYMATPNLVSGLSSGAKFVGAGDNNFFAILTDGTAKVFGNNPNGQLGDGTTSNAFAPIAFPQGDFQEMAGGYRALCVRKTDQTLYCVGDNYYGQMSVDTGTPSSMTLREMRFPTSSPTKPPTFAPTRLPTKSPTFAPTRLPTKSPTFAPTQLPTKSPTFAPTRLPTKPPTFGPTKSPTFAPTKQPTTLPTLSPSTSPTISPTRNPTKPTKRPTNEPTRKLTKVPTEAPTKKPTLEPTSKPSTAAPTKKPTKAPTEVPTKKPTKAPTEVLTKKPTLEPTAQPNTLPTPPTSKPTSKPTQEPTVAPTKMSTDEPTSKPTKAPTKAPTKKPTLEPTSKPSTAAPTKKPTKAPTPAPTKKPTLEPTAKPTRSPIAPVSDEFSACKPKQGTNKATCTKLIKTCEAGRIAMQWYGAGCTIGGKKTFDGGCQCDRYCGFKCKFGCNNSVGRKCTWDATLKACKVKGASEAYVRSETCVPS